jgi:hypothetical protein
MTASVWVLWLFFADGTDQKIPQPNLMACENARAAYAQQLAQAGPQGNGKVIWSTDPKQSTTQRPHVLVNSSCTRL